MTGLKKSVKRQPTGLTDFSFTYRFTYPFHGWIPLYGYVDCSVGWEILTMGGELCGKRAVLLILNVTGW